MKPLAMLESTRPSLLIVEERPRTDLVIGVPHHAPAGTPRLPCSEHGDSDENAGYIGRRLAEKIGCNSVIACNATVDPNKHLHTAYTKQIVAWRPRILIEIHGHGKVRSNYDVEISCGSSELTSHSEALADAINQRLASDGDIGDVSVCGRFSDIYFRATKTLTITDPRWFAYHIELSSRLRKPESGRRGKPTRLAYQFCDLLAAAIREKHG